MRSLYKRGELPVGDNSLARLAKVGAKSFERMRPFLDEHFDFDEHGRWTNWDLLRKRGKRTVVPALELPAVDPHRSAVNKVNGAAGGAAKARNAKSREALGDNGSTIDAEVVADLATDALAKQRNVASEMVSNTDGGATISATPSSEISLANASRSQSLSVCLLDSSSEISSELTDKQTSERPARASDTGQPSLAKSLANLDPVARANELAKSAISDEAMVGKILKVCNGDKPKTDGGRVSRVLPTIRGWIAKGLDFDRDILPAIGGFARTNADVLNCANTHIREEAFRLYEYHTRAKDTSAANEPIKVYRDDPTLADVMDTALTLMGKTRKVFQANDAGGCFAMFKKAEWALAKAQADQAKRRYEGGAKAAPS